MSSKLVYWIISDEIKINRKVYFLRPQLNGIPFVYRYRFTGVFVRLVLLQAKCPFRYLLSIPITVLNWTMKTMRPERKSRDQQIFDHYRWQIDKFCVNCTHEAILLVPIRCRGNPFEYIARSDFTLGWSKTNRKKNENNLETHGPLSLNWFLSQRIKYLQCRLPLQQHAKYAFGEKFLWHFVVKAVTKFLMVHQ